MINLRNNMAGRSPYTSGFVIKYDDGDLSLERKIPVVLYSNSDKIHTLKDGETLQSIAYQYYGDSGFWYFIAEANGIMNPFNENELPIGKQLIIPLYGLKE